MELVQQGLFFGTMAINFLGVPICLVAYFASATRAARKADHGEAFALWTQE